MARIKFLDVLEETKTKPHFQQNGSSQFQPRNKVEVKEDMYEEKKSSQEEPSFRKTRMVNPENTRFSSRERVIPNDEVAFEGRFTMSNQPPTGRTLTVDNRTLMTVLLGLLFGILTFFIGYTMGKSIDAESKKDNLSLLQQAQVERSLMLDKDLPNTTRPLATTVNDNLPLITASKPVQKTTSIAKKTPVKKESPKITAKKEFVVQISAHASMTSAREIEDKVRSLGYEAYTSESTIGDAMFYRVRIRGIATKSDADKILTELKNQGMGTDAFVLTLD